MRMCLDKRGTAYR